MKTIASLLLVILLPLLISSCIDLGDNLETHTIIHEDGSIERKIIIESRDSADMETNPFAISAKSGWIVGMRMRIDTIKSDTATVVDSVGYIEFRKSFASIDEANKEMAEVADTIIAIKASMDKKFRWFYTDIEYSDTYTTKLSKTVLFDDYFSQEEYEMIKRDEHSGEKNPGDSLKRKAIQRRLDKYFQRSMFDRTFANTIKVLKRKNLDSNWIDSVRNKKDYILKLLLENDYDQSIILSILTDSLKVPVIFDKTDETVFKEMEDIQFDIFLNLTNLKVHSIEVPHDLTGSNADSTAGRVGFWRKPGDLVLLKNFAMTANYRQLNYWAIGGTTLVVIVLIFLFFRRLM